MSDIGANPATRAAGAFALDGKSMKKHWLDNPRNEEPATREPERARVPASFSIGPVAVRPATVLAPMAGVTDTIFRRFIRNASLFTPAGDASATIDDAISNQQSGCGLIMTEFTSADGLSRMREAKRKRYLTYYDDEHPIAAQLFGSDPRTLSEAAKIVEDAGFDVVDLNLGCPAKRVVSCNGGSGLLRETPASTSSTSTSAARQSASYPVTAAPACCVTCR